jgi:hypothetical protein
MATMRFSATVFRSIARVQSIAVSIARYCRAGRAVGDKIEQNVWLRLAGRHQTIEIAWKKLLQLRRSFRRQKFLSTV